jgi:hypothetical protein
MTEVKESVVEGNPDGVSICPSVLKVPSGCVIRKCSGL